MDPTITVEESADRTSYTGAAGSPFILSDTNFADQFITASTAVRYLRITTTSVYDLDLDAVSYSNVGCTPNIDISNLSCAASANTITGTVYEDFNYNGCFDTNELQGISQITVTATDATGGTTTATTASDGSYTLSGLTGGTEYRIEFTNLPNWARPTFGGSDNGTTVQFTEPGNCANLGISEPAEYSQPTPYLTTSCFAYGAYDGTFASDKSILAWRMDWGANNGSNNDVTSWQAGGAPREIGNIGETGTIYGMAYNPLTTTLYSAAYLKNFSDYGPDGPGAIYATTIDPATGQAVSAPALAVDVTTLAGVTVCADPHGADINNNTFIEDIYNKVGKCGLADLEISGDYSTLYVMNMSERKVVAINTADFSLQATYGWSFSNSTSPSAAAPGTPNPSVDFRPFALAYHRGTFVCWSSFQCRIYRRCQ